jgi:hypothetical protein
MRCLLHSWKACLGCITLTRTSAFIQTISICICNCLRLLTVARQAAAAAAICLRAVRQDCLQLDTWK